MAAAFADELGGACGSYFDWDRGGNEAYAAMLAAAPTPPASAQDEAKDDQPVAKVRRGHYGGRVGNIGFQEAVLLPGVKVMDNTLLYTRPAPAAGDARELLEALKEARRELHACQAVIHLAGGFDPAYVTGAQAAIRRADAALSASQQQEG
ncbi:hypothetical protein AL520_09085 [Achromobacter xylosoxidans]|nr:hypothetical protein AL520_09085 [Achromobacter xylosoxidans]